jgi:integrase
MGIIRHPSATSEMCMRGNIYTSERCPQCGGKLIHDENRRGLFCKKHPNQKASGKVSVRFGRQIHRRFSTYAEGIRFLTGLRFKTDEGIYDARDYKTSNPLGFETQVLKWLRVKEHEVKPNSYRDIRRDIGKAVDFWGQTNVKAINYGQIEDWIHGLELSSKSKHNALSTLKQFLKWLERREGVPMPDMPNIKYELGWRNIIDMETQKALLDEVKRLTWDLNPKIWIGINWLATYVAIRPNEMRHLRERHINVSGFFVIPSPKEKKPKLVPMLDEDIELYESLPRGLPDLYFFRHHGQGSTGAKHGQQFGKDQFWRWWNKACQNLGIEGVDLYGGTRHSTASYLGQSFSKEQLREHGTMHGTNKAFERYVQTEAGSSRELYKAARESTQKEGKIIDLASKKPGRKKTAN